MSFTGPKESEDSSGFTLPTSGDAQTVFSDVSISSSLNTFIYLGFFREDDLESQSSNFKENPRAIGTANSNANT